MAQDHSEGEDRPKIETWELDLVKKVAKAFRTHEQDELEAELAVKLLELKLNLPPDIRDWKSYLAKFLYNKASNIIRSWRSRESKFLSLTDESKEISDLANLFKEPHGAQELKAGVSEAWKKLTPELQRLWEILSEEGGDRTAAAKRLGKHRNTITAWVKAIQKMLEK